MISKKILAVAALAACSTFAQAEQVGPYIGGGLGITSTSVDCAAGFSCDDSSTGFKVYGGYNFTPMFGVQVDYVDFGKASLSYLGAKLIQLDFSMWGAAGVVNVNFDKQWSGSGKLGLASVTTDGSGIYSNGSQSNTKLYGGLDIAYAINPKFKIRAGWDFTQAEYTYVGGAKDDGTVHLFSVGASYSF